MVHHATVDWHPSDLGGHCNGGFALAQYVSPQNMNSPILWLRSPGTAQPRPSVVMFPILRSCSIPLLLIAVGCFKSDGEGPTSQGLSVGDPTAGTTGTGGDDAAEGWGPADDGPQETGPSSNSTGVADDGTGAAEGTPTPTSDVTDSSSDGSSCGQECDPGSTKCDADQRCLSTRGGTWTCLPDGCLNCFEMGTTCEVQPMDGCTFTGCVANDGGSGP